MEQEKEKEKQEEKEEEKEKEKEEEKEEKKGKKQISGRCYQCNKKLKMIHFTCRCNHMFCIIHQNPHSHNCNYDAKKNLQIKLKNENPKTIHQKLIKI